MCIHWTCTATICVEKYRFVFTIKYYSKFTQMFSYIPTTNRNSTNNGYIYNIENMDQVVTINM